MNVGMNIRKILESFFAFGYYCKYPEQNLMMFYYKKVLYHYFPDMVFFDLFDSRNLSAVYFRMLIYI